MLVVNYQTWVMGISQNSVLSKAIETKTVMVGEVV